MHNSKNRALVLATALAWSFVFAYVLLPVDLIPDFIPILGWFDDLFGVTGTLGLTAYTVKKLYDEGAFAILEGEPPQPIADVYDPIPESELRSL